MVSNSPPLLARARSPNSPTDHNPARTSRALTALRALDGDESLTFVPHFVLPALLTFPRSLLILCDSGKFVKLVGENDMEAVLQRLDRLTRKEAQTMATHTMELVCGLVKNIKVVMDGACGLFASSPILIVSFPSRGKRHNGWCPSISQYVLLIGCAFAITVTAMPVLIQQLSHDINKSRRAYNSQFNCQRRRPRLLRGWPVTGNVPALTISSGSVQKP